MSSSVALGGPGPCLALRRYRSLAGKLHLNERELDCLLLGKSPLPQADNLSLSVYARSAWAVAPVSGKGSVANTHLDPGV